MELISNHSPQRRNEKNTLMTYSTELSVYGGISKETPKNLLPAVQRCVDRYHTFENFINKLGYSKQSYLVANFQDDLICVPRDKQGHVLIPTVQMASYAFSYDRIKAWLLEYIINLNEFILGLNPDKKMTPNQQEEATELIIGNYGRQLFVTEIPVIFSRIKAGYYGKAYGIIDGSMIMNCFTQYLEGRQQELDVIWRRKDEEARRRQEEEDAKTTRMSLDEWRQSLQYAEMKAAGISDNIEELASKFNCELFKTNDK